MKALNLSLLLSREASNARSKAVRAAADVRLEFDYIGATPGARTNRCLALASRVRGA